jgi:hypothetical protein
VRILFACSSVRTGAARDSYNHAASRFSTTSSTYGSSYNGTSSSYTASKPPPYRSRVTSPSPSRIKHTSTVSTTSSRPLPPGPGPRDQYGHKISATDARSTFRKTSRDTPTRLSPMKADHSYHSTSGYSSGNNTSSTTSMGRSDYSQPSSTSTVYHTPRLSREKRTNSISDLTSSMESMGISPRPSLRKFGSTTDINGNVDNYSITDISKRNGHHANDVNGLPDINDRPNSASRSPSMDRVKKNNTVNNNYSQASTSVSIIFTRTY